MTPTYSKAARALLGWKQEDLAKASGVSLTALKNFENGTGTARAATILALSAALEAGGVAFLPGGGLRLAEETIQSYRFAGKDCIEKHNALIYATLRHQGDEILTCSPDDTLWLSPLARKANAAFKDWRGRLGIKGKTITCLGANLFNEPRQQYRFLPKEMVGTITYVIFGNKISFILWPRRQVFVLQNPLIVDTFRRQFTFLWNQGAKSPLSS